MENAPTAADIQGKIISDCIAFSSAALYAYEYVVTLDQEVKYIWAYPNRGMSTWLLAANRYVPLMAAAVYAIPMINYTVSDPYCIVGLRVLGVAALLQFLIIALLAAVRTSAVTGHNKWFIAIVFVLISFPVTANIYAFCIEETVYWPEVICTNGTVGDPLVIFGLSIATRTIVMAGELLVAVLTLKRTIGDWRVSHGAVTKGLGYCMIRDGSLYFVAMILCNLLYVLDNTLPALLAYPPIVSIIGLLPSILASRMVFNLRHTGNEKEVSVWEGGSAVATLLFRNINGDAGEHTEEDWGSVYSGPNDEESAEISEIRRVA